MKMVWWFLIFLSSFSLVQHIERNANDFTAGDPFEEHFTGPGESKLSRIIRAISEKKWTSTKKEFPDGLRLARAVPNVDGNNATVLPAMEHTTNVKVSKEKK